MIQPPHIFDPLIEPDRRPAREMQGWMQDISDLLTFEKGEGSPEGVIFAREMKHYLDAGTGETYLKTTEETLSTGWVKIG